MSKRQKLEDKPGGKQLTLAACHKQQPAKQQPSSLSVLLLNAPAVAQWNEEENAFRSYQAGSQQAASKNELAGAKSSARRQLRGQAEGTSSSLEDRPRPSNDWEAHGFEYVDAVRMLLSEGACLSRHHQESLILILLNHELHTSHLSLAVLELLQTNARLHPPSAAVPQQPGKLVVQQELWTPDKRLHTVSSAILGERQSNSYDQFLLLWKTAQEYCCTQAQGRLAPPAQSGGRSGLLLLLHYCVELMQADWDARQAVLAGYSQDPGAAAFIKQSLLWQMMSQGPPQPWKGTLRNHAGLVQHLVSIIMDAQQQVAYPRSSGGGGVGSEEGPAGPGPSLTSGGRGAGSRSRSRSGTPGPSCAPPHLPESRTLTLHCLGGLAGWMLRTLYDMYSIAEDRFTDFYIDLRQPNKGTDRAFLAQDVLLPLLSSRGAKAAGYEVGHERGSLHAKLSDLDAKLTLARVLSPAARLHLLTLTFTDRIKDASWRSGGVEGLPTDLPPYLKSWQEYLQDKGWSKSVLGLQVEPLKLLQHLAEQELPGSSRRNDSTSIWDTATKTLFKVGSSVKEQGGFKCWLAAYLQAVVEHMVDVQAPEADWRLLQDLLGTLDGLMQQGRAELAEGATQGTELAMAAAAQAIRAAA